MKELSVKILRPIWQRVVPRSLKNKLIPHINVFFHKRILKKAQKKIYSVGKTKAIIAPKQGPLTVSAFFREALGIGRGGHCSFDAFEKAGYSPVAHDLRPILNTRKPFSHFLPGRPEGGVHFIHCNPPEVLALIRALHPDSYKNNYRIGYWAYELPKAPKEWIEVSHFFHEIWVPSQFVKEALEGVHCPIRVMPHDVMVSIGTIDSNKVKFYKSNRKQTILLAGDLRSSAVRKNLTGGLKVFFQAFPAPDKDVDLIIKLSSISSDKAAFLKLKNMIDGRADIKLITDDLDYQDIISLVDSCDILLSPHRSEGYGLMLAEAIALKKVVLATGWSGNMEFMSEVPQAHLPFHLVPVNDAANIYSGESDQLWADVDIKKAAEILKTALSSHPDFTPALKRLQEISDMWDRSALQEMLFSKYVDLIR